MRSLCIHLRTVYVHYQPAVRNFEQCVNDIVLSPQHNLQASASRCARVSIIKIYLVECGAPSQQDPFVYSVWWCVLSFTMYFSIYAYIYTYRLLGYTTQHRRRQLSSYSDPTSVFCYRQLSATQLSVKSVAKPSSRESVAFSSTNRSMRKNFFVAPFTSYCFVLRVSRLCTFWFILKQ